MTNKWRKTRKCVSRPYTVQYRESNLDFVLRLLEFEGIWFESCDDGPEGSDDCTPECTAPGDGTVTGCCSSTRGPGGAIALTVLVGALLWIPRRRRPRRR